MKVAGFPTSSDIYLEVDGKKVAVVQSYTAKSSRTSQTVEAFGEDEPVATIPGQRTHVIELTRLYATDEAIRDGLNFHTLEDFSWSSASRTGRSSTPAASGAPSARPARWGPWWWRRSPS